TLKKALEAKYSFSPVTITVTKAGGGSVAALSIDDAQIGEITVDSAAVTGAKGKYSVQLDSGKFDSLDKSKVTVGDKAISGLKDSDKAADVLEVNVANAGANKTVTLTLKKALEAKYSFSPVTITVTKAGGGSVAALSIDDAQIGEITVDSAAVTGAKGKYSVQLDSGKFDSLDKSKVTVGDKAISGLKDSDKAADVLEVNVANAGANKTVTLTLKKALEAKYSFSPVTITVTKQS
ncbi:MAG: hypothetical protein ACTTH7_03940, partial [Treponema sp.]